jgi:hypothetical protein
MSAAVTIASSEGNRRDPAADKRKRPPERRDPPLMAAEPEFTARDLGVLVPSLTPAALEGLRENKASNGAQIDETSTFLAQSQVPQASFPDGLAPPLPVRLPSPSALPYSFEVRQQWEGVVTSVSADEFSVVLRDIINPSSPEMDAVLPTEEVAEDDLELLQRGAVLYWTIGYEQTHTGQRRRISNLRFRRLPAWSRADIQRVKETAREFGEIFSD